MAFCGDVPIRSVWQQSRDLYAQAREWPEHPAVQEYGEELRTWGSQPGALAMARTGVL